MKSAALLIVDVQIGFINEHTSHIPAKVNSLIHEYDRTFATRFFNPENSNYRRLMHWGRFSLGSQEIELAFQPLDNTIIIDKPIYTCVTENFIQQLDDNDIHDIHVVGIDTDICVMKCAVDLFEAGLRPVVLAEYCASHGGEYYHRSALKIISRYIGSQQVIQQPLELL